jgi:hypothetical protein
VSNDSKKPSEWRIVDGIIRDPGKFEGEPRWAPHFYERGGDGFADLDLVDDEHAPLWGFLVTEEDVALFPELAGVYAVSLEESDQGFVYSATLTQKRYEELELEG